MKKMLNRYLENIHSSKEDLPYFWLLQTFLLSIAVIAAKGRAVYHAYGELAPDRFTFSLLHCIPYDLLFLTSLIFLIVLSRKLFSPGPRVRWMLFFLAPCFTMVCSFLAHFNYGYYAQMGQPLNADILSLAPHMAVYLLPSVSGDNVLALIAVLAALVLVLAASPFAGRFFRPYFVSESRWTWRVWLYTGILATLSLFLLSRPALGVREIALREMTIPSIFLAANSEMQRFTLDPESRTKLMELCGPVDNSGHNAFAKLPRRPYNIVIWVKESTGIRYLKSLHPLGVAKTPNLDAAIQSGAVQFDAAYSECPLSVQSGWAMLTGQSPPPFPKSFVEKPMLPSHEQQFTSVLKEKNYNTAVIIGGPTPIWGLDKIVKAGRVDLFHDLASLTEAGYSAYGWAIEGKAINETFLKFIDSNPGQPFFGLLWQVESHHPFRWYNASPDDLGQNYNTRYIRSIEHVDRLFGDFYAQLAKRGLLENTLIVVVGDHGEGMGRSNRPYDLSHSHHVYEDAIHVPLMILNPAFKGTNHHVPAICSHIDLEPTLLDLCGFETNPALPGVSLARPISPRPFFPRSQQVWPMGIRVGKYKMVLMNSEAIPELYDLQKDPPEEVNIAGSNIDLANLLAAAIRENASKMLPSKSK